MNKTKGIRFGVREEAADFLAPHSVRRYNNNLLFVVVAYFLNQHFTVKFLIRIDDSYISYAGRSIGKRAIVGS